MKIARTLLALLALAAGASAGPNAKVAKTVSGTWNMATQIRGLPVMMVIRQDGNIYPSFWFGNNSGGTFSITGAEEALTDDLRIESKGGFVLKITRFPPKAGMEEQMPGGMWMRGSPFNMYLEFKEFTKWKRTDAARGAAAGDVRLSAQFTGNFHVNGATMPISGTAAFNHKGLVGAFTLFVEMTIPGSDFGLEGDQARPMHITLHAYSPTNKELPGSNKDLEKIEMD